MRRVLMACLVAAAMFGSTAVNAAELGGVELGGNISALAAMEPATGLEDEAKRWSTGGMLMSYRKLPGGQTVGVLSKDGKVVQIDFSARTPARLATGIRNIVLMQTTLGQVFETLGSSGFTREREPPSQMANNQFLLTREFRIDGEPGAVLQILAATAPAKEVPNPFDVDTVNRAIVVAVVLADADYADRLRNEKVFSAGERPVRLE